MIHLQHGNLLNAKTEAIVNTVNTVGVMGKGIALQFKQAFPENYRIYERACRRGDVSIGRVLVVSMLGDPRYIINFPTKRHWRARSKLKDIESGLDDLVRQVRDLQIGSIAVPPLGCGNGGLDWADVRPRIEAAFAALPDVRVEVYEPAGAPAGAAIPVANKEPGLTLRRAAIVGLLAKYLEPGYEASTIEIQKLAYFLQEAGQRLKLRFGVHVYGPYTETVNDVLRAMEGQFTRGYGDRTSPPAITLAEGALPKAQEVIGVHPDLASRIDRVAVLIEGYESPYGLELLATAHWLIAHEGVDPFEADEFVRRFRGWNARKRRLFRVAHIQKARKRLIEYGWAPSSGEGRSAAPGPSTEVRKDLGGSNPSRDDAASRPRAGRVAAARRPQDPASRAARTS